MTLTNGKFLLSIALPLLAGLLYVNALHAPFVYDDYHTVESNHSIQPPTTLRAIVLYDVKRPVVNLSYFVDRAIWGPEPFGFHLTNVLLHMLNVVLLFQLGVVLTGSLLAAGVSAALFGVHPIMTEGVTYISGRSEVLCAALLLAALLCMRQWIPGKRSRWAVAAGAFWVGALATKEIAAMVPFALVAFDRAVYPDDTQGRKRRTRTVYLPVMALAVAAGVARLVVLAMIEHPGQVAIHWPYVPIALDVVRRYLGLIAYPAGQTLFHSVPRIESITDPRVLLALAVIAGLVAIAWRARARRSAAAFGIAWFLLMLVPSAVLTVLDQGEPMAEHRVYAAAAGFFLACGVAVADMLNAVAGTRSAVLTAAAAGIIVATLSVETVVRNQVWASPITLWAESVVLAPDHFRPRLLLGEALLAAGRPDEAAEQFRTAIRLRPGESVSHAKLGGYFAATGQLREAREAFSEAIRLDPRNEVARQSLALLDKGTPLPEAHDGRQ